ncbi:hypothetical protein PHYPO_G00249080 [Pangasianodon hypophthalmus]|uniref:Acyl-CoA dehydrogenase n=1 Tax=Pangasianodon hypophthalmus TaxID=310915 RepID=A0A5N5J322_PANHP|nr:hypothetical protein PHYPO_G00249080 [Pangasianodon hypophthalmus]
MMLSRCVSSFLCRIKSAPVPLCCRMQYSQHLQGDTPAPFRPETSMAKTMMDIGTQWIFSEEHDLFRQNVRRFFKEEVVPYHTEWEKAGEVSREVWEKAGLQGLLGIYTPAEHGGVGGDLLSAAIVWEEQSWFLSAFGDRDAVHQPLWLAGSDRALPTQMAGKCIGAIAMSEPGAGSDLQGVKTYARRDGTDWILNGNKVFITNGWMSDLDTAELFFEDVRLPADAVLGETNKGFYYLMNELPQERLIIAAMALASGEFMFEETRNYVTQRKAFGKTIADLRTEICVGRAFIDNCLQLHSERKLDSSTASMAKYWASELQNKVATQCLHNSSLAFVDARVQPIYSGTNEIMKELIARTIVGHR